MTTSTTQPNIYATFLTDQQIWGDENDSGQLEIMKINGTKVGMSDLAILLGGCIACTTDHKLGCAVWSASSIVDGHVRAVYYDGDRDYYYPYGRYCCARPALPSSVTSSLGLSEAKSSRKVSGVEVVEFGEYPQTIAAVPVTGELEHAFSKGRLQKTGKAYNFDNEKSDAYDKPFNPKAHDEYLYNGKKYIRVEAKPYKYNPMLSNGKKPQTGEVFWVEVQPIEWLVEPEKIKDYFGNPERVLIDNPNAGMLVARHALFAGVQFDGKERYDGDFENTDMYRYLQDYFIKEIVPSKAQEHTAGVLEIDTPFLETKAKENMTHHQDIVAKGSIQDWSSRDFSAKPKEPVR